MRHCEVTLRVEGTDGYVLNGKSSMNQISRDPADLAAQALNANHQLPDGFVLFLGTLFAPHRDATSRARVYSQGGRHSRHLVADPGQEKMCYICSGTEIGDGD